MKTSFIEFYRHLLCNRVMRKLEQVSFVFHLEFQPPFIMQMHFSYVLNIIQSMLCYDVVLNIHE